MRLIRKFIIFTILIFHTYPLGQQETATAEKYLMRIGATQTYSMDVKLQDLNAAFKLWTNLYAKRLSENHNIEGNVEFKLYESIKHLESDINENKIDLINLPIQEYSRLTRNEHFEPTLTGNTTENKFTQFVLLANKSSGLETIRNLEGKNIIMPEAGLSELMKIWLQVELYKNELPDIGNFFNSIQNTAKENMAIYSVFFNKIDCALVRKSTFDISSELNPQIKSNLRVISVSPEFIANLIAIRKGYDPDVKKLIIEETTKFHLKPEDKQVLTLFKFARMHELNEEDMENVEELFDEYKKYNMLTFDKK